MPKIKQLESIRACTVFTEVRAQDECALEAWLAYRSDELSAAALRGLATVQL